MRLIEALPLAAGARLALVGAGGKSTALFALARQRRGPTWLAASTHLALAQAAAADQHIVLEPDALLPADLPPTGVTLFTGLPDGDGRLLGLKPDQLNALHTHAGEIPLLVEADGSRRRPLKGPAAHEPAVPEFVTTVVVVAGWGGLGRLISEEVVHRPERFAELAALEVGAPISASALTAVLVHPQGGMKNIPLAARRVALLNQCDTPEMAAAAASLAPGLLAAGYAAVLPARLEAAAEAEQVWSVHSPVAGVVLAAGGSARLGEPKQLLIWRGQPFIRVVCQTALAAGLAPVVVVLGAHSQKVREAINDLPLQLIEHVDWEQGQSSSVKAGLAALPPQTEAVVFMQVDQPQIPAELVRALLERWALTRHPVVAPLVDGRRGTPVLFGRETFEAFAELQGDDGGRQLLRRYEVEYVPWLDLAASLDVDTPEDYARLLNYEE